MHSSDLPHHHAHNLDQIMKQSEQFGDFEQIAGVFEKLSDARRVQIYWILCHCEECVTDLAVMIGTSSRADLHPLDGLYGHERPRRFAPPEGIERMRSG